MKNVKNNLKPGSSTLKLSIFARLLISSLVFFVMLAGVSLFFIYHLNRFNQVVQSIVQHDASVVEFSGRLSDLLLSQARNERLFVLLNDEQLYRNYLEDGVEFARLLQIAQGELDDPEINQALQAVTLQHLEFTRLAEEEHRLRRSATAYDAERYDEEKQQVVAELIATLQGIRQASEKSVFAKISNLRETGEQAAVIAVLITIGALFIGLLVAAVVTRSITRPLQVIKAKTREIAHGNFQGDLQIASPPIIKELAIALNSMCHKLQELDNLKSAFFADMSHELRTPLASIKEGTHILLDRVGGEINNHQQRILLIISQESDRLINRVNSLLDLARMEAGMVVDHYSRTSLSTLVRDALQGLQPLAEAKGVRIVNHIAALPPVNVDQERIMQVVRNLVGNAIKFTPEGGTITLTATVRDKMLEVAVQDTGIGIPEGDLERIFLKFQQVLPARSDKVKGSGLGLAMVKQIILAHGGKVWATSQIEKGSTFYFTLPLAE
ncbi:sensor histidine kinase [Desulfurivibrio alkaliphilus]|uniref:histidine kinase n=1 Tax=Desulfurivibrio alkaliphilus (strain DSM 19089 / UNIQEM U267 / AHT2) TaxID=589865 RepID=D6Z4J8_DESAT|nr:HAMP domain-containing sensor histidine kinase [Desulfurivibrio alkaliphilus]ADH86473.1 integral membrane sensor signal transduction histidine kinase [Desulfurivibrio alkaliphilus AHT 2]